MEPQTGCNVGDLGSIPGLGRSPGEAKGYPLQYSGLENSMNRIVHGVAKSQLALSFSHASKVMLKILQAGFNSTWTENFQVFKLNLEKAEEPEIKLPTSVGSKKKQVNSKKTSTSASLTTLNHLTVWITINCENSSRDGNTRLSYLPPEKPVCRSRSNS